MTNESVPCEPGIERRGAVLFTVPQLTDNPRLVNEITPIIVESLNSGCVKLSCGVGWETIPIKGEDDLLRNGYIMIAKATRQSPSYGRHIPLPDAVFLRRCLGNNKGRGKWVYFTVGKWDANPPLESSREYKDFFLSLGLPVHVASFRGLEREREYRLKDFLALNAVVYNPKGELSRIANVNDFDQEGVLVVAKNGTKRLFKGQ